MNAPALAQTPKEDLNMADLTRDVPGDATPDDTAATPQSIVLSGDDADLVVFRMTSAFRVAIAETRTVADSNQVLGKVKLLQRAMQLVKMNGDSAVDVSAMRVDAERRVGQLMVEERKRNELASHGGPRPGAGAPSRLRSVSKRDEPEVIKVRPPDFDSSPSTLEDLGISREDAAEYGRLADTDDDVYEEAKAEVAQQAKERGGTNVSRKSVLRAINPERERSDDQWWLLADRFAERAGRLAVDADDVVKAIRFNKYPGDWPDAVRNATMRQLHAGLESIQSVITEMQRKEKR